MDADGVAKLLAGTSLLRRPRRSLNTFGATRTRYHLVSAVEDLRDRTRLREGLVVAERPRILTADSLRERFEGFGKESLEFADWLSSEYRAALRALEYRFSNREPTVSVLHADPSEVARRIESDLDARSEAGDLLIRCPDAGWSLALMKFTLDEASRSFPGNVRDLDRRGLFDPGAAAARRDRAEIERLFPPAALDPVRRQALGRRLKELGLFEEFEDRFLALFR